MIDTQSRYQTSQTSKINPVEGGKHIVGAAQDVVEDVKESSASVFENVKESYIFKKAGEIFGGIIDMLKNAVGLGVGAFQTVVEKSRVSIARMRNGNESAASVAPADQDISTNVNAPNQELATETDIAPPLTTPVLAQNTERQL